jgi:hypothetical protein
MEFEWKFLMELFKELSPLIFIEVSGASGFTYYFRCHLVSFHTFFWTYSPTSFFSFFLSFFLYTEDWTQEALHLLGKHLSLHTRPSFYFLPRINQNPYQSPISSPLLRQCQHSKAQKMQIKTTMRWVRGTWGIKLSLMAALSATTSWQCHPQAPLWEQIGAATAKQPAVPYRAKHTPESRIHSFTCEK